MKIRHRITLLITGAGLLAGLLFSTVIVYELIEQPYDLLDDELENQAHALLAALAPKNGQLDRQADRGWLEPVGRLYWLKVYNRHRKLIYASSMTRFSELPLKETNSAYNAHGIVPQEVAGQDEDDSGEVTFRIRVFTFPLQGHDYLVQIARPMERLAEEITDLLVIIGIGLACFTVALIGLGYVVAGRILQPVSTINRLVREISDKTLDRRIPLSNSRDELHTLSASLNRMFDRLQFSFQHQKEFMANAAHDLKTPIAMQRLFFDEAGQRSDLPADFQDRLAVQIGILYRMERLVKNLLDLSALELRHSFEAAEVNLSALAAVVLQEFAEIIQSTAIRLTVDIQDRVCLQGEAEQLKRALINLLDNAIKYASGREKEIRFLLFRKNNTACIEIFNSGLGIREQELKRVFDQFYRVDKSRSAALGGSGLGLTIVKRIVELHKGTIWIESEWGKWTRVHLTLPLEDRPA